MADLDENAKRLDNVKIIWFELAYTWLQMAIVSEDICTGYEEQSVKKDCECTLYYANELQKLKTHSEHLAEKK